MGTYGDIKTSAPRDVYHVIPPSDFDKIDLGKNVRHSIPESRVQWMAESIAENRQTTPGLVGVKPDGSFELLGGATRLAGLKFIRDNFDYFQELYGLSECPGFRVTVRPEIKQSNWLMTKLVDNQVNPLSAADKVECVRMAKEQDWEDEKIARALGVSMGYLGHLTRLLRAREDVLDALQDGLLTMEGALATLELDDEKVSGMLEELKELVAEEAEGAQGESAQAMEEVEAGTDGAVEESILDGQSEPRAAAKPLTPSKPSKPASTTGKKDGRTASKAIKEASKKLRQAALAKKVEKGGRVPAMTLSEVLDTLEFLMETHTDSATGQTHEGCPYAYFLLCAIKRQAPEDAREIVTLQEIIYDIHNATGGAAAWGEDEAEMVDGKAVSVKKTAKGSGGSGNGGSDVVTKIAPVGGKRYSNGKKK